MKSDKQIKAGRINGKFAPGVSGNPDGRPKGISITEMVKEALEELEPQTGKTWKALLIQKILVKAIAEGDINLIRAIWNYIDGMPKQTNDITSAGEPIKIDVEAMLEKVYGRKP